MGDSSETCCAGNECQKLDGYGSDHCKALGPDYDFEKPYAEVAGPQGLGCCTRKTRAFGQHPLKTGLNFLSSTPGNACYNLSSKDQAFCSNHGGFWQTPFPDGPTELECCTFDKNVKACPQPSHSSGIQCPSGANDSHSLWACFKNSTICVDRKWCIRKPEYQTHCDDFDQPSCERQVHCQWPVVQIHWQCGAAPHVMTAHADECNLKSSKEACDEQTVCEWKHYSKV